MSMYNRKQMTAYLKELFAHALQKSRSLTYPEFFFALKKKFFLGSFVSEKNNRKTDWKLK